MSEKSSTNQVDASALEAAVKRIASQLVVIKGHRKDGSEWALCGIESRGHFEFQRTENGPDRCSTFSEVIVEAAEQIGARVIHLDADKAE